MVSLYDLIKNEKKVLAKYVKSGIIYVSFFGTNSQYSFVGLLLRYMKKEICISL